MSKSLLFKYLSAFLLAFLIYLTIILAFSQPANALTGPASRFDWSLGQPAIAADNTITCSSQATARFDWSIGQPAIVYDATATCTAGGGAAPATSDTGVIFF